MENKDLDLLAERLENPEFISRKKTNKITAFFDTLRWPQTWPLGKYKFVRELIALDTGNKLTAFGFILAFPMLWFFCSEVHSLITYGIVCYIVGMLTDFVDGPVARYQDDKYQLHKSTESEEYALSLWQLICLRGTSNFGEVFDPFKDKVVYFFTLFSRGWNVIEHWLILSSLAVALILTIIRVRAIRDALNLGGKKSAKMFGKIKIIIEVVAVADIILLPYILKYMFDSDGIVQVHFDPIRFWSLQLGSTDMSVSIHLFTSNLLVFLALFCALISLSNHIWLGFRKKVGPTVSKMSTRVKTAHVNRKIKKATRSPPQTLRDLLFEYKRDRMNRSLPFIQQELLPF